MYFILYIVLLFTTITLALPAPQDPLDSYGGIFVQPSEAPPANSAPFFRNDYTYVQSTGTFYKFHKLKSTWHDALATCNNEGAGLTVPQTEAEATVLLNEFSANIGDSLIWLAISDLFAEGLFFTHGGLPLSSIYSNWNPGEPNDAGDKGEDCVVMNNQGLYNDVKCDSKYNFVCSTGKNFTQNTACQTYDKSYIREGNDRCYKLHKPKTWHEAFRICRDEQAYLTVINSDAEAEFLANMFENAPAVMGNFLRTLLFVDFSDLQVHGVYRTNAGGKALEESGYMEWAPGQPDNFGGNEHCGSIFKDGPLNDVDCNVKAMFVCEKDITPKSKSKTSTATRLTSTARPPFVIR